MGRLGRFWYAIIGVVALGEPAWRLIRWLFEIGSDFDLLHSHGDIVNAALRFLIDPPGWFVGLCLIGGLLLIWWDVKRRHSAVVQRANVAHAPLEFGLLPQPILNPRFDTISLRQMDTAVELYERAEKQRALVVHYLAGLDDRTRPHAENLCSVLRSLMASGAESPSLSQKEKWCEEIAEKLVLLKGNDILIYADDHFKFLPERNSPPEKGEWLGEFQLIIAFKRREEYADNDSVTVPVDYGQARWQQYGFVPKVGRAKDQPI